MPSARQASTNSPTTSPWPFFQGLFRTQCSVYLLGQRQKPSWCFAVRIIRVMPADLAARTHWRASSSVGLNCAGFSVPSPHSRSVKVFMPKWMKAEISSRCQAICRGVGRTSDGLGNYGVQSSPGVKDGHFANTQSRLPSDRPTISPTLLNRRFMRTTPKQELDKTIQRGLTHRVHGLLIRTHFGLLDDLSDRSVGTLAALEVGLRFSFPARSSASIPAARCPAAVLRTNSVPADGH